MSLEDRIERLERDNHRLKVAALLVMTVLTAAFTMGQARAQTEVVAQRFTLVNAAGERLAEFGVADDGMASLNIYDEGQQNPAIRLGLVRISISDGARTIVRPRLVMFSGMTRSSEAGSIHLDFGESSPSLSLHDQNGKGRIVMHIDTSPRIQFWNPDLTRITWAAP